RHIDILRISVFVRVVGAACDIEHDFVQLLCVLVMRKRLLGFMFFLLRRGQDGLYIVQWLDQAREGVDGCDAIAGPAQRLHMLVVALAVH
ncbi:MAG: hypothetical protein ACKPKO_04930, partial [Candidatus Fonsibacter sp.]